MTTTTDEAPMCCWVDRDGWHCAVRASFELRGNHGSRAFACPDHAGEVAQSQYEETEFTLRRLP